MIDVTDQIEQIKHHAPSGIMWVKLRGDDGFEWAVSDREGAPEGYVYIGGANNGSFRIIKESVLTTTFRPKLTRECSHNAATSENPCGR